MFADDIALVSEMIAKHGRPEGIAVECGGLESPTIADYQITVRNMALISNVRFETAEARNAAVLYAQKSRYLDIHRPLDSALPGYLIENPETGGLLISELADKYHRKDDLGWTVGTIGTAVLLSVLEHVDNPFQAVDDLREAMKPGGLVIVSVPFTFPYHAECGQDCWRFTPTGLRKLFANGERWSILETDWRLDIPAEAGVIDVNTGRAVSIKSCYLVARAL